MPLSRRLINKNDATILLDWRNNIKVVQFSKSARPIEVNEHENWFLERLSNIDTQPIFLFELNSIPVGTTRLDPMFMNEDKYTYEISVLVDPLFQNRGIGLEIIQSTLSYAASNLFAHKIIAIIHKENLKSINLFSKTGFTLEKAGELENYFVRYAINLEPKQHSLQ